MFARGIIAPEESTPVPLMSPEAPTPCAQSLWDTSADTSAHARKAFRFMAPPHYFGRFGRHAASERKRVAGHWKPSPTSIQHQTVCLARTDVHRTDAERCDPVFCIDSDRALQRPR